MNRLFNYVRSKLPIDTLEAFKDGMPVPQKTLAKVILIDTAITLVAGIILGAWLF